MLSACLEVFTDSVHPIPHTNGYVLFSFWHVRDQTIVVRRLRPVCSSKSRNNRNSKNIVMFWLVLCGLKKIVANISWADLRWVGISLISVQIFWLLSFRIVKIISGCSKYFFQIPGTKLHGIIFVLKKKYFSSWWKFCSKINNKKSEMFSTI